MTWMERATTRLILEDEGASASEYALLVAVIAAVIFIATSQFNLGNIFAIASQKVGNCVNSTGSTC